MDWQDTTPNMGDTNPVTPITEVICASLCIFCIKFPRTSFAIIAGITCWICFSLYYAASDTPPQWTLFTDSDTITYFEYSTFGYLNGNVWIYGNHYDPDTVYYINIADKDDNTFYIQQLNDSKVNYSFNNYLQSISDKTSQTIWSIDISEQKLVSFDPYSKNSDNIKLYQIPDYYNGEKYFWAQCMAIDDDKHLLYILGGYNNATYHYEYCVFGEVLIFNLNTKAWDHYYSANDIGYLNTENGYNIDSYSCSYNNKWLFAFGGAYSYKYPFDITYNIHYIDFNIDNIKWNTLSNATLNLSLIQSTAYTFGEDIYIFAGCDINRRCYMAQQIFNLPSMRVTDYDIYESLRLPYDNYYVVNNYDEEEVYIMYSDYKTKNLVTCYFQDKIDAVYNQTYLIIAISCIIVVVGVGLYYYNNKRKNSREENEPLRTN